MSAAGRLGCDNVMELAGSCYCYYTAVSWRLMARCFGAPRGTCQHLALPRRQVNNLATTAAGVRGRTREPSSDQSSGAGGHR